MTQAGQRVKGFVVAHTKENPGNEYKRYDFTGTVTDVFLHPNPTIGHTSYIRLDLPIPWRYSDPMLLVHCAGTDRPLEIIEGENENGNR